MNVTNRPFTSDRKRKCLWTASDTYRNRANPYVINRMLASGLSTTDHHKATRTDTWTSLLRETSDKQKSLEPGHISYLVDRAWLRRLQGQYTRSLSRVGQDVGTTWARRATILKDTRCTTSGSSMGRLILSSTLLARPGEIFFSNEICCSDCNHPFRFDSKTHVRACVVCGVARKVLFLAEDRSQDSLVAKTPLSVPDTPEAPVVQQHPKGRSMYLRSPLFRKFLSQFSEEAPVIPPEVMRTLYQYLSNIHLQTSVRCRPTPISSILRGNGHANWAHTSVLISKLFNGEPVPVIAPALIEKIVHRFDIIFHVANRGSQQKSKKKIPPFEFLAHVFLYLEGRRDLSIGFSVHKSRAVLLKTFDQLSSILEDVVLSEINDVVWEPLPIY